MEGRYVVDARSGYLNSGPLGDNLLPRHDLQEKINKISTKVPRKQGEHDLANGTQTVLDLGCMIVQWHDCHPRCALTHLSRKLNDFEEK